MDNNTYVSKSKNDLFGGSKWSKFLSVLSIIFLLLTVIALMSTIDTCDSISKKIVYTQRLWKIGILFFVISVISGYIAYLLAGGKKNSKIWQDKNLFNLLRHAVLSGEAKIGFHSLRDQKELLINLASIGIKKKPSEDSRKFISDKLASNYQAFYVLRDSIIIQTIHNAKECFWDGYGNKRDVQFFHRAEIIFDLNPDSYYMFSEVLKDLK